MEDEATLWLTHWLLATNAEWATTWFWFFNKFHRPEFTSQELQSVFAEFLKENIIRGKKPASSTLKSDAFLLPKMYAPGKNLKNITLDEGLDSPLSLLRLVAATADGKGFQSKLEARPNLPVAVVGFAVTQLMKAKNVHSIPIEELLSSRDDYAALGSVFRLTEMGLVTQLENLVCYWKGIYELRETAGIHQLYKLREGAAAMDFLKKHYQEQLAA